MRFEIRPFLTESSFENHVAGTRQLVPIAAAATMLIALAACNSNAVSNPRSTPSVPGGRFYAAGPFVVRVFQGPFSASSAPIGSINPSNPSPPGSVFQQLAVALDPTDTSGAAYVAGTAASGQILKFSRPNPNGAPPTVTVSGFTDPREINFDSHGNLFVPDRTTNTVSEISHPITGASVPTTIISSGLNEPVCVALDASDTLFVLNSNPPSLLALAAPYTGVPVSTANVPPLEFPSLNESCAYDRAANLLFVANSAGNVGYALPLTANETPSVTMGTSFACEGGIAFDNAGNAFISGATAFDINNCTSPNFIAVELQPFTGNVDFTFPAPDGLYSQFAFGP